MVGAWQRLRLGDFLTLEYGKPLEKSKRLADGMYPAYGANGIKCRSDEFYFDKRTIIVGRKGSAGELTLTEEKFWPLDVTYFVKFDEAKYDLLFVFYLLSLLNLPSLATGVKPGINRNNVYSIEVSVPELPEQKRIVAILDQAFADIEQARAKTEQNLKNARELFESYLQQVFSQRGEEWVGSRLQDIVQSDCSLSYGVVQPGADYVGGLPVVRPTDLKSVEIRLSGLKLIKPELARSYTRTTLQGGDLLVCVRGSTGVVSIAARELKGANVTRGIVPIRFDSDKVLQKFGYYQFIAKQVQDQIREGTYGAALMQINIRDLRKLDFVVPSLSFQAEAITKLDDMRGHIDGLEAACQRKAEALDELKKSILQKAFTGQLTAKDAA